MEANGLADLQLRHERSWQRTSDLTDYLIVDDSTCMDDHVPASLAHDDVVQSRRTFDECSACPES
jgi:hypothetical protein